MNKKRYTLLSLCIILIFLCIGCTEKQEDELTFDNITLESNVVELINASMNYKYDKTETITRVEVIYLFKNIADYIIEKLNITVQFFDKNNNLIATAGPKYIRNLPVNYVETSIMEANKIIYEGPKSNLIDHCKIIAIDE
jgi:hypothetical protein